MKRIALACPLLALLLAGCAGLSLPRSSVSEPPAGPAVAPEDRYLAEQDAAVVAAQRAAPAPADPALEEGRDETGERNRLAAQGYARIGTGQFRRTHDQAREAALQLGRSVGAERILLYPPPAGADEGAGLWLAAYYVRYRLAFGATFRDQPGEAGVVIGEVLAGTPASLANLLPGDQVLAVDGQPVRDRGSFQRLLQASLGKRVTLSLRRNGETLERVVVLGTGPGG